jgi:hypothetical protein
MSKVKNQFGKQRHQDAKLRTQNHKTHDLSNDASFDGPLVASADQLDVEPKTLDPKPETDSLLGPNFALVYSFESWVLTQAKLGRSEIPRGISQQPNSLFCVQCRVFGVQ